MKTRRGALLTVLVLALLVAPPARADQNVTSQPGDQNAPDSIGTSDGIMDAYVTTVNGKRRCAYKINHDPLHNPAFGSEQLIPLPAGYDEQTHPKVTVNSNGDFVVICETTGSGKSGHSSTIIPKGQDTPNASTLVVESNPSVATHEKPKVANDPIRNRVIVVDEVDPAGGMGGGIGFYRSPDGGQTWSPVVPVEPFSEFNTTPNIAVDPIGYYHVSWTDFFGGQDKVFMATSTNGGTSFISWFVANYTRSGKFGPMPIGLYVSTPTSFGVLYSDCPTWTCQIMRSWTLDGGSTWTPPAAIVPNPSLSQVFPVVRTEGSRIHVVFFQQTGRHPLYNVMYTTSTDGGASWSLPQRVNDVSVDLRAVVGWHGGANSPVSFTLLPNPPAIASVTDSVIPGTGVFPVWAGLSAVGNTDLFTAGTPAGNLLVAAVLPTSRSVQVGVAATAFVTVINAGATTATDVAISPLTAIPATFLYQTTDASNVPTGTPNTPVSIPAGGFQTFVIAITPTAAFGPSDIAFSFMGTNTVPVRTVIGLNTLLGSGSTTPVSDIVALSATIGNTGIVKLASAGAFAVATVNVGASGLITATADTGGVALPVTITLCETNPGTGACLAPPSASVQRQINAGETPTFGVFVSAGAPIPFDPANNRIQVHFAGGGGGGGTSVAVCSVPLCP